MEVKSVCVSMKKFYKPYPPLTHYCLTGPFVPVLLKLHFKKKVGIIDKISYERRDYESVDEKKSLS